MRQPFAGERPLILNPPKLRIAVDGLIHTRYLSGVFQIQMPLAKRIAPSSSSFTEKFVPLKGNFNSWSEYWNLVEPRLKARAEGFKYIFDYLNSLSHAPVIVETGTLREPNNFEGDGCSTKLFDTWLKYNQGKLLSVDIDPAAVAEAKKHCKRASIHESDSVEWLSQCDEEIDVLYLDSFNITDWNFDWPASAHHLKELLAAFFCLSPGSIIVVDDNVKHPHTGKKIGKGRLVREAIEASQMATLVHDGYQEIYMWEVG